MRLPPPQDHHPTRVRALRPFFIILSALSLTACAPASTTVPDLSIATTASATGRTDDLTAALATARRLCSLATLTDQTDPETHTRTLTLLDNLDNRVTIIATPATAELDAQTTFDIAVTYGLWGDPKKESQIIQILQQRLQTLGQRHQDRQR